MWTFSFYSLEVEAGQFSDSEILVMLGENGTGKTTFIWMMVEKLEPDKVFPPFIQIKLVFPVPFPPNITRISESEKRAGKLICTFFFFLQSWSWSWSIFRFRNPSDVGRKRNRKDHFYSNVGGKTRTGRWFCRHSRSEHQLQAPENFPKVSKHRSTFVAWKNPRFLHPSPVYCRCHETSQH